MEPSYNDSFGQGDSGGTGIISSGDAGGVAPATPGNSRSDIILSSSDGGGGNGGKRRFLVVIVVLLFIVAIGAGVAMWLMGQPGGGKSETTKGLFNEYANFLLSGKDSGEYFGEFKGVDYVYYFDNQDIQFADDAAEQELIMGYYSDLGKKIKDFYDAYTVSSGVKDDDGDIDDYIKYVLSFVEINKVVILDGYDIEQLYKSIGYEATAEQISSRYSSLIDSQYDTSNGLGNILVELNTDYLDRYDTYVKSGCVNDGIIDYSCGIEAVSEYNINADSLGVTVKAVVEDNRERVLTGLWSVYEKI